MIGFAVIAVAIAACSQSHGPKAPEVVRDQLRMIWRFQNEYRAHNSETYAANFVQLEFATISNCSKVEPQMGLIQRDCSFEYRMTSTDGGYLVEAFALSPDSGIQRYWMTEDGVVKPTGPQFQQ